ncbi:MAG: 8-oxo-dGTP diphosphatase MutT [Francisellaceae bacterium]
MIVIEVAVAVILNRQKNKLYLTQRRKEQHLGSLWEFPGGKLEAGESPESALSRELKEEIGIELLSTERFHHQQHDYDDRSVRLYFYCVENFNGEPEPKEGQIGGWFAIEALKTLQMPKANDEAIARLLKKYGGF